MRLNFKSAIVGLLAALAVSFGAFGLGAVQADIDDVPIVDPFVANEDFTDFGDCDEAEIDEEDLNFVGDFLILDDDEFLWICVTLTSDQGDSAVVNIDSNDIGIFDRAICSNNDGDGEFFETENFDDFCEEVLGLNTDNVHVECDEQADDCGNEGFGGVLFRFTCDDDTGLTEIRITVSDSDGSVSEFVGPIVCQGDVEDATISASPSTVEIVPAPGNQSFSNIRVTVTGDDGQRLDGVEVDFRTDNCWFAEEVPLGGEDGSIRTRETFTNTDTLADLAFVALNEDQAVAGTAEVTLQCHPGTSSALAALARPGPATITAIVDDDDEEDIVLTTVVTVIGPPASITVAASPTSLRCGEKSTITATVKDSIGQNVSDHTLVEMVTNLGGVLGGTGAVAFFGGPVVPISSTVAETFGGVATAFLVMFEVTSGPYEVIVTAGGSFNVGHGGDISPESGIQEASSVGIFSTAPVSAQVTVTCTIPTPVAPVAPTVTAPRTGTGITPPNTGDGGLASSSSSWALFAIGGVAAFALAGLATLKFARR